MGQIIIYESIFESQRLTSNVNEIQSLLGLTVTHIASKLDQFLISSFSFFLPRATHTQTHRHSPLKAIRARPIHEFRESRGHSVRVYRMRQSSAD